MADEEVVNPQEQAADNKIQDFRTTFSEALLDTGHIEHSRRANELRAMYEARYAGDRPVFDPSDGVKRPEDSVDQIAAEEMRPLKPEEFDIGADSAFGLEVDQSVYGFDTALEAQARQTFATAQLNGAQARVVAQSYYQTMLPSWDLDTASRQSTELLKHEYGEQAVDRAIAGTNQMLKRLAGPEMYSYIRRSGLGAHPAFVGSAVKIAKQRGWWK